MPLNKINIERKWSVMLGGLAYRRSRYDFYERLFQLSPAYSEADVTAVWFEHSSHLMMVEEPGRFLVHLVQAAPPYAKPAAQ